MSSTLCAAEIHKRAFTYAFEGTPSVKDTIEAIGVPHTEIDVILIDGAFGRLRAPYQLDFSTESGRSRSLSLLTTP
jgi:hypothetical protein